MASLYFVSVGLKCWWGGLWVAFLIIGCIGRVRTGMLGPCFVSWYRKWTMRVVDVT